MTSTAIIKANRQKPIINRHPWIFSGAIESVEGDPQPGDIITIVSPNGEFLARGYWNPSSQIEIRILTWEDEPINEEWWRRMLTEAIDRRAPNNGRSADGQPIAYRLVNAENDYIPGLVIDRYGEWIVLQALTLGIDQRKTLIAVLLGEILKPQGVYERSDVEVRQKEGLQSLTGQLWGKQPPQFVTIDEGVQINVDLHAGHKTGLYLDQRQNRHMLYDLLTENIAGECRLLNTFSYTGAFGLHALEAEGVHVVNVDSSQEALEIAGQNVKLNNFPEDQVEFIQADVFDYLRDAQADDEQFDLIILDPPKFAHNKQQIQNATRGYKDLNLNAFKLIKPGGYLLTFSCSGAISPELFKKVVFGALTDSGRNAQILRHLGASDDHPVALSFPEGAYLKGLLLRVY